MSENIIDALVYSSMNNNISETDWSAINPDFRELTQILDKTTAKRLCCMNKGLSGNENKSSFTVKVRLPLPKDINGLDLEKKYGYYDKEITVPASICNLPELSNYKYTGEGGNTTCDKFYKGYCENILNDYKKLSGADKDPNKFDMNEFNKFKPECACYTPAPSGLPSEMKQFTHCWLSACNTSPYRPSNLRDDCKFDIQQCIQNVTTNIGSVDSSQVAIQKANLINNCSKSTSTSSSSTSSDTSNVPISNTTGNTTSETSNNTTSQSTGNTTSETPNNATSQSSLSQKNKILIGVGLIVFIVIIIVMIMMKK